MEIFYSYSGDKTQRLLDRDESTHCVRVLRHREDDEVIVVDGCGTMYECALSEASEKQAVATVNAVHEHWHSHPYDLTLAVCPTKNNDRTEWLAEKATEIGVDRIVPMIGDRSERKVFKAERLQRILVSAMKQSLKAECPQLAEPLSVKDFIAEADPESLRLIAYCFEGQKVSVKEALSEYKGQKVTVLIGPEGDFSPEEAALAIEKGFVPVHLGESRLRTETAGVMAAAAVYFRYME